MYKFDNGQISIHELGQPIGMKLHEGNRAYCRERGVRLTGPALGRPRKDAILDKKQNCIDECERVEVERRFSLAKRCCGRGLITARLQETACHCIAMSILLLNLRRIQRALWAVCLWLMDLLCVKRTLVFVQGAFFTQSLEGDRLHGRLLKIASIE